LKWQDPAWQKKESQAVYPLGTLFLWNAALIASTDAPIGGRPTQAKTNLSPLMEKASDAEEVITGQNR